jgi:homoserine kinase type II
LADASEELAALVTGAERDFIPKLPRQLVHGDFWDNNICFRGGLLNLITDLDFMCERARIDDMALTLYYTNLTFSEDQLSDDRRRRLRTLVDAYDRGLDRRLSSIERAALPLALTRTPLCLVGMIGSLDTEREAKKLASEISRDIGREPGPWQEVFT